MTTIAEIAAQARMRAQGPAPAAPLRLRPRQKLERMTAEGDAAARAEVSRRGTALMQARADPATYLGGARAPEPTAGERAIGFAGRRVGVPLLMAGRALPGGELGYQLMRRFAPEHVRAAAGAVEESLAVSPMVPKWVPGLGGWQPVRTAMQIAPFVAGGAAGLPGFAAAGVERGLARPIGRGESLESVLVGGATGGLEAAAIGGAFQVAGKLTPMGRWRRGLTAFERAQRRAGLPGGPPPPPRATQVLAEKISRPIKRVLEPRVGIPRQWRAAQQEWRNLVRREGGDVRRAFRAADDFVARAKKFGTSEQKTTAEGLKNWTQNLRASLKQFMERRGITDFQQAWNVFRREGLEQTIFERMTRPMPRALSAGIGEAGAPQWPSRKVIQERLESLGMSATNAARYATRIAEALGPAGGNIFKAAIAVNVRKGLARKLAEAMKPALLRRERSAVLEAQLKEFTEEQGYDAANLGVADAKNLLAAADAETEFSRPGFASWLLEQTERQSTRDFLEKEVEAVAGRGVEAAPVGVPPTGVQPAPPAPAPSAQDMLRETKKAFGTTEDENEALYLLSDGTMTLGGGGEKEHRDLLSRMGARDPIDFGKTAGAIRMRADDEQMAFEIFRSPTEAQRRGIVRMADSREEVRVSIDATTEGGKAVFAWSEQNPSEMAIAGAIRAADAALAGEITGKAPAAAVPPPPAAVAKPKLRRVKDDEFEKYLRDSGVPYVAVDEAKKALFGGVRLDAFDFVVYRESGPNWLVTCEPFKNKGIAEKMGSWEEVFGEGFVAVEVVRGPAGMVAKTLSGEETPLPAGKVAPGVGEGAEVAPPPTPGVEAGPARDLLGAEVRPKEVQRDFLAGRGVEAVWQTLEGVSYVLTPDGMYATRSDGTGPLIPKDDVEALRADARKAAPPAPAAKAPEPSAAEKLASTMPGWQTRIVGQPLSKGARAYNRKLLAKARGQLSAPAAPAPPAKAAPPAAPAVNATLAAQAAAKKQGIDLGKVRGTGSKGLITRKDVRDAEKLKRIQEASAEVGAPLRPGTIIEQTRQALEDEGLPTGPTREGEIAPPRGREAALQPRKPPITPPEAPAAAAPEPEPGEEVPFEVLAKGAPAVAPTVKVFARLSPEELVRMLGKIPGPYGKTLADTKEVGQAVKALRQAMKNQKVAEAAAKADLERMQAAYPDTLEGAEGVAATPLLDWLKGDKINAWKGLAYATEIEETIAGRPALAKLFVRKQPKVRPPQGYLDQVTDSAVRDPDSGFRGQTIGEFLDQMVVEYNKAAARAAAPATTEEALRRLARDVPEEAGAELTGRADVLAQETAAVEEARERVLAEAEPYLAAGGEGTEIAVVEMPEAAAAKRIAGLRRQLEDLRARAAGERTLSQALREDVIRVAREMARRFPELGPRFLTEKLAGVDSPKQAEALIDWMQKHAAVAERRAVLQGVKKRMVQLRKNVGALEEPYHTMVREALDAFDPSRPRERTVRGIENTIGFVGEHPELEALLPAARLRGLARLAKKPLADLDLTELRDLEGYFEWWERLAETKGRLKIGDRLRDYFADVDKGEEEILASGRDVPAHRRAEGTWRRILKRGVLDAGTIGRGLGGASDPVDRALDAEAAAAKDGQTTTYLVRNLWEGERAAKGLLVSFLKRVFEACDRAGLPFGSKKMIAAMETRVTVELPTATNMAGSERVGRVTMSAAELAETVLDYEDPNTVRQAALAGDCWGMPRTKDLARPGPTDPKIRLGPQDVAALRDALAARPEVQQVAYDFHEIYNDPATFRAMDDAVFTLDMRHLIKEGPYHPRSRNWQLEGPPRVPESFSDMRDVFLEHLGPAQARTGGGMAVVHGNLFSKAMNHFTVVSRIVGLAKPVRGAWMYLDNKAIKRAMINRHGTGLPDFYKAVVRNLMGTGITPSSTTEAVARKMMHRFAVAALGLRVQTGLRQVWSTWNTADVLGADAVAQGYKNFLAHRKESLEELMEASPIAWLRLHYYGGTDALLSGPSATIEHQYGRKTLGERSLLLVRMGDGVGVGALWEAAKAWGAKNGVTDTETLGRLWEDLLNEEGAGPTTSETYQSLLATEARRSVLARIGTFFGNFRNRIVNKIWKRVIDVRNNPKDPEAWKRFWRALVVVLLGTTVPMVGVMAGTRWVLSGGKRRPTGTGLALDAVENTVGNVYLMGDAFYAGRRVLESGTVYGVGTRQNPLARVVTSWIQGAGGVYLGVDQAISGERFRAGARRGERKAPRTLGRAASQLAEAVGYSLGLPVAPIAYWRSALRFAEGEGVAAATGEKADAPASAADLAWKASGGDVEAARRLKEQGVSLAEARRALRRRLEEEGVGVRERVERLRRLGEVWREGGVGSRERPRSFGLGRRGAFSGAGSRQNMRFPDFLRKTVPAVGAEKRA